MDGGIKTRCGFVAVIGAPNAGKSTLMNSLVGTKISIVSPKVQTTRMRVRGIVMKDEAQIVIIDTPGIFQPKRRLERAMVAAAWEGEREADIVAVIVDVSRKDALSHSDHIIDKLKSGPGKRILILNKIDRIPRDTLLPLAAALNKKLDFAATFMISALKNSGVDDIVSWLAEQVPEGPFMYPEDQLSDLPSRLLAAEVTREKLFLRLHEEIPYGLTVQTESWEENPDGSATISQIVVISREAFKPIVIGKGGSTLKDVGMKSRLELEQILDRRIHLHLLVRVRENWLDDPGAYAMMGLDPNA